MIEHKLPINKTILLTLASIGFILFLISIYLKITNQNFAENYSGLFLSIVLLFQLLPWLIVLIDIIKNHLNNKLMWYIGMFSFGSITVIIYLFNREKNLRLSKKFKNL